MLFHDHFKANKNICHLFQLFMLLSEMPDTFKYIQRQQNEVCYEFINQCIKSVIFCDCVNKRI